MNENKMNQINIHGTIYSENSMIENFIPQEPNNKILKQIDSNTNIQYYDNFSTYQESIREKKINLLESTNERKSVDSKEKIIKLLELEYEDLEKEQSLLHYSNEEMLMCDPNDYEIIECRSENLKLIQNNLKRMKHIKEELLNLEKEHPYVSKDIFKIEKFEKFEINKTEQIKTLEDQSLRRELLIKNDLDFNEMSTKIEGILEELEL
jgi:hypothetical protein